ncbi:GNAT family N-acetyltransferase [Rhodanobacter thiooxydans]|uniref:GNAT family N-acetyltransferase n=1 Tax=Rhodanobacter thiooxydans TaxID=416169 RepID=UPI003D18F0BA
MPITLPLPPHDHARRVVAESTGMPPASASLRVRRAAASDLDELVALELRSFSSDLLSRAQYRRHLDSDSALVLVASANHHLFLGSAVLFFRKRSTVARLYSLATAPETRGQGVGAALLAAVADAARRRGARVLKLEVRTDNAAAIRLYERHGFRRSGLYAHYYEDGADAWRYEQTLG